MSNLESKFVTPLFFVFVLHGLLYYVFPDQHYLAGTENTGWILYIKYICVLFAFPLLARYRFNNRTVVWLLIGIGFAVATFATSVYWANRGNLLLLQFQIPILGYFFGGYVLRVFSQPRRAEGLLFGLLIISFIAMAMELMVGNLFGQFSRSGFRSVGPFVNPNNTGIIVAIVAASYHFVAKGIRANFTVALLASAVVLASGSKTAMVLYAVGVVTSLPLGSRFSVLLMVSLVGLGLYAGDIPKLWSLLGLRELSLESGAIRSEDVRNVLRLFSDATLVQMLFGFSTKSLVDNAYLDMLSYGGMSLLAPFLMAQIASVIICVRYRFSLALFLHVLFFLAMLTTNIPRLWPTGYAYWALVSITVIKWVDAAHHRRIYASRAWDARCQVTGEIQLAERLGVPEKSAAR